MVSYAQVLCDNRRLFLYLWMKGVKMIDIIHLLKNRWKNRLVVCCTNADMVLLFKQVNERRTRQLLLLFGPIQQYRSVKWKNTYFCYNMGSDFSNKTEINILFV